jgi:5-methylcytosine-specific restriction endonuclease McrA
MTYHPFKHRPTRDTWSQALMEQQDRCCALCGYRFPSPGELHPQCEPSFAPTFDHIQPRSLGGPHDLDNLQLAHRACNHHKGTGTIVKWPPPTIPKVLRRSIKRTASQLAESTPRHPEGR